jgi:hypothetical protein
VSPNVLAVLRLITSSNFEGCSTARSAGLADVPASTSGVAAKRTASVGGAGSEHASRTVVQATANFEIQTCDSGNAHLRQAALCLSDSISDHVQPDVQLKDGEVIAIA